MGILPLLCVQHGRVFDNKLKIQARRNQLDGRARRSRRLEKARARMVPPDLGKRVLPAWMKL